MSSCRSDLPASATQWWCVQAPRRPTAAASPWRWSLRSRRLSCADSEGWTASVYSWRPTRGWKVWCLQEDHETREEINPVWRRREDATTPQKDVGAKPSSQTDRCSPQTPWEPEPSAPRTEQSLCLKIRTWSQSLVRLNQWAWFTPELLKVTNSPAGLVLQVVSGFQGVCRGGRGGAVWFLPGSSLTSPEVWWEQKVTNEASQNTHIHKRNKKNRQNLKWVVSNVSHDSKERYWWVTLAAQTSVESCLSAGAALFVLLLSAETRWRLTEVR